jgi:hypothetical protein
MRRLFAVLAVACYSIQPATADKVILDPDLGNASGVSIVAGGWSDSPHGDASFQAFKAVRNKVIGPYDFYYSLEIVPQFRIRYEHCQNNPNIRTFFQSIFGTTRGALVLVKADIQHRWTEGIPVDFLKGESALVLAATGGSPTAATQGFGCYFDQTLRPTFPLIQYTGGGHSGDQFDDFVIRFKVVGGKTQNIGAVTTLMSLFGNVSAMAGWTSVVSGIASPEAQAFQRASQTFQTALQTAGTFEHQSTTGYILLTDGGPDDGRIAITIPRLFGGADEGNGNLVIYVRRHGSIVLGSASGPITLSTVFDNMEISNRQCNPGEIASRTCKGGNDPIRTVLAKLLKKIDDKIDDANPIIQLIDVSSTDRQKKAYDVCKGIRTVSRLNLHLSTLDETMIRWAFTKEGGLQDTLKDPSKASALAAANGRSVAELAGMCWNAGDEQTLRAVAAALNRPIQEYNY